MDEKGAEVATRVRDRTRLLDAGSSLLDDEVPCRGGLEPKGLQTIQHEAPDDNGYDLVEGIRRGGMKRVMGKGGIGMEIRLGNGCIGNGGEKGNRDRGDHDYDDDSNTHTGCQRSCIPHRATDIPRDGGREG